MGSKEDSISYEILTSIKDSGALVDFIHQYFVPRETVCSMGGVTAEIFNGILVGGTASIVERVVAAVARNAEDGSVIGIKLFRIVERDTYESLWANVMPQGDEQIMRVCKYALEVDQAYKIFEENPSISKAMEHILLAVHPDFCGKGIGTKLVQMSDEYAKKQSCEVSRVVATGVTSQNIFSKLGYTAKHKFMYETFEVDGVRVFSPDKIKESKSTDVMVKMF